VTVILNIHDNRSQKRIKDLILIYNLRFSKNLNKRTGHKNCWFDMDSLMKTTSSSRSLKYSRDGQLFDSDKMFQELMVMENSNNCTTLVGTQCVNA
jgi:hypothetical protein